MEKLHPKAVWIFFFRFFFRGLVLFIFSSVWLGAFLSNLGKKISFVWWIILIFIIYTILCYVWSRLTYRFWLYELTENAFKKEHGVIWKKYVSIPYERIQNIDIRRGIIARILGLSDLQIQTAGYSAVHYGRGRMAGIGAEGYLPGLEKSEAEKLREEFITRTKSTKQGL